jgi:hypothetical protein
MVIAIDGTGGSLIRKVGSLKDGHPGVLSFGVAGYPSSRNRRLLVPSNTRRPTPLESTSLQWSLHASERASARARVCCCCCGRRRRWMTRRRRHYSLLHADMSHLQQLPHAPPPRPRVQTNACCCLQSVGDPYRPMRRWKNFLVSCFLSTRRAHKHIEKAHQKKKNKNKAYGCAKNQRDVCKPLRRT